MEHAVRDHIEVNRGKDPHKYRTFSERLEEILHDYADNWEVQAAKLAGLVAEMRADRPAQEDDPLSPPERALYGVLVEATAREESSSRRPTGGCATSSRACSTWPCG